ncbi:reverse transcriptase domain-containing protein [Clostridium sp. MD294]|uniref:reverse transcriptase domain-containing protein n=1 Tax=Clostridium sp. MD294 TaxID=97138 RepID=UPI0002CA05FE|nr:reverse transcriptase domain-containing protein [Clostridium sp. MD294]USF31303.1 Group II intron-encoded protein LtrA [Clostridium sp. MD294]
MRNPKKVLNSLTDHSKNTEYQYERLYRILFNKEMYLAAYQKIYANKGNMTKGSDRKTIDGMSLKRIDMLIEQLKKESYQPNPSRRVYIKKKYGKKLRPLGIPSFDDKLVQEVIKMILEAIYEGSFENSSHGFRSNKSCHTALLQIQTKFTGVKWFMEGDIKGFFDNIDHNIMITLLRKKIKDERFLRLIRKFLNAGYLEDWKYHKTYSGTPQGGIISPILANIYLDELDKYIKSYAEKFNIGKERKRNSEYRKLEVQRGNLVRKLKSCTDKEQKQEIIKQIKLLERKRRYVPYSEAMDKNYKRLQYTRYADDFLIGIIGSKVDCEAIKRDIKKFLIEQLKLELSEEKTLITHAQKAAKFLGYDIYIRKSNLPKRDKIGRMVRNYGGLVVLAIHSSTMRKKLLEYQAMKITYVNGKEIWKPKARYFLKDSDDLEILDKYNAEIRGFYNYYSITNNSFIINSFQYIMEYSMYKTYATKYRSTKKKMIAKYRVGKDFGIHYSVKNGDKKVRLFYNKGFKRKKVAKGISVDSISQYIFHTNSTSLMERLKSNQCEICGAENVPIEIHHVHKLKDLKGKKYWEKLMIARNRKTIALCHDCHVKLHHGLLD